jgi:hypothetical protein
MSRHAHAHAQASTVTPPSPRTRIRVYRYLYILTLLTISVTVHTYICRIRCRCRCRLGFYFFLSYRLSLASLPPDISIPPHPSDSLAYHPSFECRMSNFSAVFIHLYLYRIAIISSIFFSYTIPPHMHIRNSNTLYILHTPYDFHGIFLVHMDTRTRTGYGINQIRIRYT